MQEIEAILGAPLFQRSNAGVRPTAIGQEFLVCARILLRDIDHVAGNLVATARGRGRTLRIGYIPLMPRALLTGTLTAVSVTAGDYNFALTSGTTTELLRGICEHRHDCAILRDTQAATSHGIILKPLYWQRPFLAFGRLSAELAADAAPWKRPDLSWILAPAETPTRTAINRMFITAGLDPPLAEIESYDLQLIKLLLTQRHGRVSILPEDVAGEIGADGSIQSVKIHELHSLAPICFATSRRLKDDPGVVAIQTALEAIAAEYRAINVMDMGNLGLEAAAAERAGSKCLSGNMLSELNRL